MKLNFYNTRAFMLTIGAISQLLWGLYPGFLRYLQTESHAELGGATVLTVLAITGGVFVGAPLCSFYGVLTMIQMDKLWLFFLLQASINSVAVFAVRYTLSIFVQLILLSVPFIIALETKILLKESIPKYTIPAMVISSAGAFLSLFGGFLDSSESSPLTTQDVFGLSLAALTAFLTASLHVFIRTIKQKTPSLVIMWMSFPCIGAVSAPLAFALQEDWGRLQDLVTRDYIVFACLIFGSYVLGGLFQILSIRWLGAALTGALQTLRLVSAVAFGMSPLLNEKLNTLNIIGVVIVLVTVGAYLFYQFHAAKKTLDLYQTLTKDDPKVIASVTGDDASISSISTYRDIIGDYMRY